MAQYKITSLNYIAAGKRQAFINVDAALDYQRPNVLKILDTEQNQLSVVSLDQGNIEYIDTEHIKKENGEPLSLENLYQTIVLKEDQKWIKNVEAKDKSAILLKSTDDIASKLEELSAFQAQVSAIQNLTFELEVEDNSVKNNLLQDQTRKHMLPMYNVQDLAVKTANKKKMASRLYGVGPYVDIYAPAMKQGPLKFCEANGFSYMLLAATREAPQYLNAYLNDSNDNSFYMQLSSRKLKTYAYEPLAAMNEELISNGTVLSASGTYGSLLSSAGYSVDEAMSKMFQPKTSYRDILYNYILDFDQSNYSLDYDAGDIYAKNINIAKNIYNSLYTIDMPDADTVEDAREYCSIGAMSNNVFLTYIDDVKYEAVRHADASEASIIDAKMQKTAKTKTFYKNEDTGEIVS